MLSVLLPMPFPAFVWIARQVLSGDCQPGPSINPQNAPVGITFWSLPGSLEPLKDPSADGRDSTGAVRKCVAGLRPAQAVSDLVAKEREKIGAGLKDAFVLHLEVRHVYAHRNLCEARKWAKASQRTRLNPPPCLPLMM